MDLGPAKLTQSDDNSPKPAYEPALQSEILTPSALEFITRLQRRFGPTREFLLAQRRERQQRLDAGHLPDFLPATRAVRESAWRVAPLPADLRDRRVEITGPVDRKMVINALNSGARVYMADFEDSHSPTWQGTLEGQKNLRDAIRRTISFANPDGKQYRLHDQTAVLMARPRGWHLVEKHLLVDGEPISASLFDFGLYFFHNARELLAHGTGPYFYLPKLESHLEARLWNDVFVFAQRELGLPNGTIRATVLIETILAAFEMDEILFELRDHSAGLNCGRWDYIFSFIKKLGSHAEFILPDRAQVTMDTHFLRSYCELLIATCHKRGAPAMGGMAAQIPIKNDPAANEAALRKVTADKQREVSLGHDGTWVAHPGLVGLARQVFDAGMPSPNQIDATPASTLARAAQITARDLLAVPPGEITPEGIRKNIRIALLYLESWLRGVGCVPLYNLMEDAATAEISRAQVWQWIRHGKLAGSEFRRILAEEAAPFKAEGKIELAARILDRIVLPGSDGGNGDGFVDFLTLPAYEYLD